MAELDFTFRPKSYWDSSIPYRALRAQIREDAREEMRSSEYVLTDALLRSLADILARRTYGEVVEAFHVLDFEDIVIRLGQVVIAEFYENSSPGNTVLIQLMAYPAGPGIRYDFSPYQEKIHESVEPLSLGKVIELIEAYDESFDVLPPSFKAPRKRPRGAGTWGSAVGSEASSAFYPDFEAYYRWDGIGSEASRKVRFGLREENGRTTVSGGGGIAQGAGGVPGERDSSAGTAAAADFSFRPATYYRIEDVPVAVPDVREKVLQEWRELLRAEDRQIPDLVLTRWLDPLLERALPRSFDMLIRHSLKKWETAGYVSDSHPQDCSNLEWQRTIATIESPEGRCNLVARTPEDGLTEYELTMVLPEDSDGDLDDDHVLDEFTRPYSLGEFVRLIDEARSSGQSRGLVRPLLEKALAESTEEERNQSDWKDRFRRIVTVRSEFYPQLQAHYEAIADELLDSWRGP